MRLKPEDPASHENLANAFRQADYFEGAIDEYRTAIRLSTDQKFQGYLHAQLGNIFWEQKQLEESISEYREALRLGPLHAGAHFGLGLSLSNKGYKRQAAQEFREFLRLAPGTLWDEPITVGIAKAALKKFDK